MGSPVSPILANLIMEDIENKAMTEFHHPPKVWKHYVDDTFVVIKRKDLQQFFKFLNSIERTVQCTQEIENDGVMAFLDVKLTRESTGYLDYTVYSKPTHIDRYLNFRSDHPLQHKKAVIKTLLCREKLLTSNETNYQEGMDRIQLANGYPPALTARSQNSTNTKKMVENRCLVVLPYYRGLSEKLQRCLRNHNIKSFFKPMRTIGDKLRNEKDPVHPFDRQGAVYCVPCGDQWRN